MRPPQVLSRALNTHNYKKDVTETGGVWDRNPSAILGRAQDSLFSSKNGLRRLFGGGPNDDAAAMAPDEPETVDMRAPVRNTPNPVGGEGTSVRVGRVRRSSMTTYTVNLGATTGQVEREVRRLAGLMPPSFARPTAEGAPPLHATSFDAVVELDGSTSGARPGSGRDSDSGDSNCGAVDAGSTCRPAPIKSAFGNMSYDTSPFIGGGGGGSGGRGGSNLNDDVTPVLPAGSRGPSLDLVRLGGGAGAGGFSALSGSCAVPPILAFDNLVSSTSNGPNSKTNSALTRSATVVATASSPQPSFRASKAPSSLSTPCLNLNLASATLTGSPAAAPPPGAGGQLGLMKDRKALPRRETGDDYSSSTGRVSPVTPGGGGGGVGGAAVTGTSPTAVLRLPVLPQAAPSRAASNSQITAFNAAADSRPTSSRMLLRGAVDRKGSLEPPASVPDGGGGSGGGHSTGSNSLVGGGGSGSGGGRWFQQDADDVNMMLAGSEELLLQKIMAAAGSVSGSLSGSPQDGAAAAGGGGAAGAGGAGGPGPGAGSVRSSEADWLGQMSLLPRIMPPDGPPDRAMASLQELRKVQASLEDQFSKERQAIAAGKVRRASVLEDVAGQQQPRWQITYNTEAPVTHAKLGIVDASRRSEVDKTYLAKIAKEQKPAQPAIPAAAVSPVVARARRLSTVLVG